MNMRTSLLSIVFLLLVNFLLTGCEVNPSNRQVSTESVIADTVSEFVSGERVGNLSQSVSFGNKVLECTDDGIYYVQSSTIHYENGNEMTTTTADTIYFMEHGSNSMIRLCGRPDCTHDNFDCNAIFMEISCTISSYDGYLYVVGMYPGSPELFNLYRMDPDGNNRIKVLDGSSINTKGYPFYNVGNIVNGVFVFNPTYITDNGTQISDNYYYKLDGSMKEPLMSDDIIWFQDGDTLLRLEREGYGVDTRTYICSWDPDTNTTTRLFDFTGVSDGASGPVYYGSNAVYFARNGKIIMYRYSESSEQVLFDTGLGSTATARFFSDCIVVINPDEESPKLFFFDWDGTLQGELTVEFPHVEPTALMCGETHERIYLRTSWNNLPQYYIEKSDFGTGNIELHEIQYPDLEKAEYDQIFRVTS